MVTTTNWDEDLTWLLRELQPDRWKVFQVLKIIGENDGDVEPLLINESQFNFFLNKHKAMNPVAETNDDMTGSYVMIDPRGRFYDNILGYLSYSRPILRVGVEEAFNDIQFIGNKFLQRGGLYDWINLKIGK